MLNMEQAEQAAQAAFEKYTSWTGLGTKWEDAGRATQLTWIDIVQAAITVYETTKV